MTHGPRDGTAQTQEGQTKTMTAYAVIAYPVGDKATVIHKTLREAMTWAEFLFADGEEPGPVTIERLAMTSAEVDALPEFQGY